MYNAWDGTHFVAYRLSTLFLLFNSSSCMIVCAFFSSFLAELISAFNYKETKNMQGQTRRASQKRKFEIITTNILSRYTITRQSNKII